MKRAPYDPFRHVQGARHSVVVPWDVVESDDEEGALKTLARFRKAHPEHGRLLKESLTWGYAWAETPTLLDMDKSAADRVERRVNAIQVSVAYCCVVDGDSTTTYSRDFLSPPSFILEHLLEEELDRMSGSDWMGQEDEVR